jgi:Pyridoxamine 5'-phosphate oxidase
MPLPDDVVQAINNAWNDRFPCLLGTMGKDGPNISPKGSLFVYDDNHLAYWERARMKALENLQVENRVVICYARMGANFGEHNGFLRFYGTAEVHEEGPVKDAIFARLTKREQEHEGADKGAGVLIRIDRTSDSRGLPIM